MALEHGIEVIELDSGGVIVEEVRSSVVFLVGTAPIQLSATPTINEPVLLTDGRSAAQYFGSWSDPRTQGYSIPQAYYLMGLSRAPLTIAVNVFDPATMRSPVVDEVQMVSASGTVNLMPSSTLTSVKSGDGNTTYPNTAYSYEPVTGVLQRTSNSPIAPNSLIRVSYSKPDPSLITPAEIIGGVDAEFNYTGLEIANTCRGRFGFSPKLILAPHYSHVPAVASAMTRAAVPTRAIALIDAPSTTTMRQALESRGTNSEVPVFIPASERANYLYPAPYVFDPAVRSTIPVPYSAIYAGVIAETDSRFGYHYSPSSKPLVGVEGLTAYPTFNPEDFDTEANLLNEAGIVTAVHQYGRGLMTFGNRNASYPGNTQPTSFTCIRRTADMIYESIVYASLQYLDLPLTRGWIDAVTETVNEFIAVLVGRGALYVGSECYFDISRNPTAQLVAGRPVFSIKMMPPPPAEKITFEVVLDTALLREALETSENQLVEV